MDRRANGGGANSTHYDGDLRRYRGRPKFQRKFLDMFTEREACLAGLHELRTQLEAAGIYL